MITTNGVGITTLKNGVAVKQALSAANSTVNKGVYDATLLETVDADLAVANIKSGVTIFGVLGTLAAGTLAEDVEGDTLMIDFTDAGTASQGYIIYYTNAGVDMTLATKTLIFDASSLAFAAGFASVAEGNAANDIVLHLYMGGVLMQTSAELPVAPTSLNFVLRDFKALSGNQECKLTAYQTVGAFKAISFYGGDTNSNCPAAIAVGSVKLV